MAYCISKSKTALLFTIYCKRQKLWPPIALVGLKRMCISTGGRREDAEAEDQIEAAKPALQDDWADFLVADVTQSVVEIAGEFADTFALRGYDSVQLTTARFIQQETELPVQFACFDKRLNRAALLLGMEGPFLG